jgi:uncharacterized damage-inducible protein DinB
MNKQDIQLLFKYNSWANKHILDATANVTQEQFIAPASYPHGGLRGTLTHALFAEWIWRTRWQGESPSHRIKPEDFPTFKSLRSYWENEEKLLIAFLDSLTDEKLNATFKYKNTHGEPFERVLWQAMVHVVNHGTQHRSEAAALLTDLNHSPGDIDLMLFLNENHDV